MNPVRDFRVMGFVGAVFAEGGRTTIDALRNIGLGDWTLTETVRVAYQAVDSGLVEIDKHGTVADAGAWYVSLVGREVQRV